MQSKNFESTQQEKIKSDSVTQFSQTSNERLKLEDGRQWCKVMQISTDSEVHTCGMYQLLKCFWKIFCGLLSQRIIQNHPQSYCYGFCRRHAGGCLCSWCIVLHRVLEMWANAQRDSRPTERDCVHSDKRRVRRLFNAAVWLAPTSSVPCSNAAKTRNPLKFAGVPQTNETISAASGPKFTILQGHVEEILLLNKFFYMP